MPMTDLAQKPTDSPLLSRFEKVWVGECFALIPQISGVYHAALLVVIPVTQHRLNNLPLPFILKSSRLWSSPLSARDVDGNINLVNKQDANLFEGKLSGIYTDLYLGHSTAIHVSEKSLWGRWVLNMAARTEGRIGYFLREKNTK